MITESNYKKRLGVRDGEDIRGVVYGHLSWCGYVILSVEMSRNKVEDSCFIRFTKNGRQKKN